MPNRPAIPRDVQREIFVEAGHRCAVCGTPFPLERAHIIPWSQAEDHSAENLICLCANCHERADKEWDTKTLAAYKKRPWIHRHPPGNPTTPEVASLEITIDLDIADFDDAKQRWLRYALASFLDIHPESVNVKDITPGSVKVKVEMPKESAGRLIREHESGNTLLRDHLRPLTIQEIEAIPERPRGVFISYHFDFDSPTRHDIVRTIEDLELEPHVVRYEPAHGRRLTEAYISHVAQCEVAILVNPSHQRLKPSGEAFKANLYFELGYLRAKLGRDAVFLLEERDAQLPAEALEDFPRAPLDEAGEWRVRLEQYLASWIW